MSSYSELYREIKDEFSKSPKSRDPLGVDQALMGRFYRPIGMVLAPIFIKMSFSANQVTLLSVLFGTLANILFVSGDARWFVTAALCYIVFCILDYTDGLVARHYKKSTYFGKMIDLLSGTMVASFIPFFVGYGVTKAGLLPGWMSSDHFLFLSALASINNLVSKFLGASFSLAKAEVQNLTGQKREHVPINRKGFTFMMRRLMLHLRAATAQMALLIVTLLNVAFLFPIGLLALATFQLGVVVIEIFRTGPTALSLEKL